MRHEYRKAVKELAAMQKKDRSLAMLRASTSFALGHYSLSEILASVRIWSLWLCAWVYGKQTDQPMPPAYALPIRFTAATPRKQDWNVWRGRGAPTPCESSTEDNIDEPEEQSGSEEEEPDSDRRDFTSEDDCGF